MLLSLIVAKSRNDVIGRDGGLPWHIPEDLKFFRKVTMGKPVIMGRKTYQSIGRALPGRLNIVITRNKNWQADGVTTASGLSAALQIAEQAGAKEAMVIGGEEIYRAALPLADRIYLTEVDLEVAGDARFPAIDQAEWVAVWRAEQKGGNGSGDDQGPAYAFVTLERRRRPAA